MKEYNAQNIENNPTYEEMNLGINSDLELKESLNYVRENVNIETEGELEEAKKLARVTDPISSLFRAREYGLKFGDSKLVQNAENKLEKMLGKLPQKKVVFSSWYENGVNSLLEGLTNYELQNENNGKETIYLVSDGSIKSRSASGHFLFGFGTCVGKYAYYEDGREDIQILREAIKEPITENQNKLVQDFWKYAEQRINEKDVEREGATGGRKFISMREKSAINYLKEFLNEKGYNLERIDSYDKLPFALDSYVQLSGTIGWRDDEEKVLGKLTKFSPDKIRG